MHRKLYQRITRLKMVCNTFRLVRTTIIYSTMVGGKETNKVKLLDCTRTYREGKEDLEEEEKEESFL